MPAGKLHDPAVQGWVSEQQTDEFSERLEENWVSGHSQPPTPNGLRSQVCWPSVRNRAVFCDHSLFASPPNRPDQGRLAARPTARLRLADGKVSFPVTRNFQGFLRKNRGFGLLDTQRRSAFPSLFSGLGAAPGTFLFMCRTGDFSRGTGPDPANNRAIATIRFVAERPVRTWQSVRPTRREWLLPSASPASGLAAAGPRGSRTGVLVPETQAAPSFGEPSCGSGRVAAALRCLSNLARSPS